MGGGIRGEGGAMIQDTTLEAHVAIKLCAETLRDRVFEAIAGTRGITDEEGQQLTGLKAQTYGPRRFELVQEGRVYKTAERRKTASGCSAAVWRATQCDKTT